MLIVQLVFGCLSALTSFRGEVKLEAQLLIVCPYIRFIFGSIENVGHTVCDIRVNTLTLREIQRAVSVARQIIRYLKVKHRGRLH